MTGSTVTLTLNLEKKRQKGNGSLDWQSKQGEENKKDGTVDIDMNRHLQMREGDEEDPGRRYYQAWFQLAKDVNPDADLPVKIIDYHKHY